MYYIDKVDKGSVERKELRTTEFLRIFYAKRFTDFSLYITYILNFTDAIL